MSIEAKIAPGVIAMNDSSVLEELEHLNTHGKKNSVSFYY